MSSDPTTQPKPEPTPFQTAAVGWVFAVAVSLVTSLCVAVEFRPALALERAGVDFGMRVYTAFSPLYDASRREPGAARTAYAFVDVDEAACARFAPPSACHAGRPIPAKLVASFVQAVSRAGGRVLMVDALPPDEAGELTTWRAALTAPPPLVVLAPLQARPTTSANGLGLLVDDATAWRGEGGFTPVATLTVADPRSTDGVLRHYERDILVSDPQGRKVRVDTAPWRIAKLMGGAGPIAPSDPTRLSRIFYSLPSLVAADAAGDAHTLTRLFGLYDYAPASRLLKGDQFDVPPELVQGRLVLLGTSRLSGYDWHATPLGSMTGAEVLINAARSFQAFRPLEEPSAAAPLGTRLSSAVLRWGWKALAALPAALALYLVLLSRRAALRPLRRKGVRAVVYTLAFVAGLGLGGLFELLAAVWTLGSSARSGQAVDLVTPLLALGLDSYVNLAKAIEERGLKAIPPADAKIAQWWRRRRMA